MPDSCHTPCKGHKASCTRPRCAASWLVPADIMSLAAIHGRPLVLVKQSSLARAFRVAFLATASSFHQRQGVDCTIQHPCRRDQTCLRPCSLLCRSARHRQNFATTALGVCSVQRVITEKGTFAKVCKIHLCLT